ncbi:hypothetical protein [Halorussus marinus]|uniref:hypothetical protein n=1 Tax=Halorussus marinus TaxID=2505976 RepID=UPI001092B8E6|nr:hypothetical protein [Halorussus marinus]
MHRPSSDPSNGESSLFHLVFVWLLVGPSVFGLGWDVADAVPVSGPLSSMGAGLVFGTVVVAVLWIAGFRPSLSAGGGYFIAELASHALLTLGGSLFVVSEGTLSPWVEVSVRSLSITLAAALVFTSSGRRIRADIWKRGRNLVKTPPDVDS